MAFKNIYNDGDIPVYSCLSTDTKDTDGIRIQAIAIETDTGLKFEFDGNLWRKINTKNANGDPVGEVIISDNIPGIVQNDDYLNLPLSTNQQRIALPTNSLGSTAIGVEIENEDTTAANVIRVLTGDITVAATASVGRRVRPLDDRAFPIHSDATHISLIAQAGTPTANIIWHMPE